MATKDTAAAENIRIWARRHEAVDALNQKDWCNQASIDLKTVCEGADLVIICAPVNRIIELTSTISPFLSTETIVTDVGSAKTNIVKECTAILSDQACFIGSHPMAGSEKTGMENAQSTLFNGKVCFVTPSEKSSVENVQKVSKFWEDLGSKVIVETPEKHDELTAKGSHSPHIISAALASYLDESCPNAVDFCGNGLRDTTRIAAGDPGLWTEIIFQNREEILKSLSDFQIEIEKYREAIAKNDPEMTKSLLAKGKKFRDSL
ncbi:prephenate dehydrogenase/arogenate dehydrogenase family protein [Puniceicoccaceae bacterium K14]|nr:prephenate dehydrogenase/arogenate dehydrogenase family protein [Puniceicoccaceae bacterium K14]